MPPPKTWNMEVGWFFTVSLYWSSTWTQQRTDGSWRMTACYQKLNWEFNAILAIVPEVVPHCSSKFTRALFPSWQLPIRKMPLPPLRSKSLTRGSGLSTAKAHNSPSKAYLSEGSVFAPVSSFSSRDLDYVPFPTISHRPITLMTLWWLGLATERLQSLQNHW